VAWPVHVLVTAAGAPVELASPTGGASLDIRSFQPAGAGQGVRTMLVDALERLARSRGAARLTADVSDSALDFFRRRGFSPRQRNSVPLGGEWLANTSMDKQLAAKERAQ